MKKTLLGLAIAAAISAGQANAAVNDSGPSGLNNVNGGEFVLWVYDAATTMTYGLDLGLDFASFNQNSNYHFAASELMKATFGATLSSSLEWQVVAADTNPNGIKPIDGGAWNDTSWGSRTYITSTREKGNGEEALKVNNGQVGQTATKVNNQAQASNTLSGWANNVNGEITWNEGQTYDWGYNLGGAPTPAQFYSAAAPGESMFFLLLTQNQRPNLTTRWSPDAALAGNVYQQAGKWTLGTNGDLDYVVASEVPVPAAAWLFGSAVLGMVGIRRRQR